MPSLSMLMGASLADAYFIAPHGNDTSGDGSWGNPWATIQKFVDTNPDAGSTLYLRGGTYDPATDGFYTGRDIHGNLIGTAESPITIRNYPGETPVFPNCTGEEGVFNLQPNDTSHTVGCDYVVIDGIRFTGIAISDVSAIVIGGQDTSFRGAKHITLRNLYMAMAGGTTSNDHAIGIVHSVDTVTIEDCTFIGPATSATGGSGVTLYSTPAPINVTIRRCVFKDWNNDAAASILVWDYDDVTPILTVAIDHCTFIGNDDDIDLRYHSTASVTNSAFDRASSTSTIYDPNNAASTTTGYNFYSQQFDASYRLVAGQSGRGAASDGTDAGALDW